MADFPPIASLRSFEAVARLGSVTLAAKELHVTHSAISQQIKVLEEMVGLKLFIRHGRGVQINEEGRLYAHRSARLCTILLMPPGWCRSTHAGRS